MDAFVQLALIEKAKRVFAADPGVMLSFPLLSPLGFTAKELEGLAAPSTAADYAMAADFARTVNFLPRDLVANTSDRMLWDVYRDVLMRAEVASGIENSNAGQGDTSILYDVAADGRRVESEALKRYRQYRDAWFVAREDYASHKLTGELSEDPAIRENWTQVEEPSLRAALDAASADWDTTGNRAAIELALNTDRSNAFNKPGLRWAEWSAAFNPDVDMITDPVAGSLYAATGLSPRNFAQQEDWLDFDLSASEMKALVDSAPEALKVILDDEGSNIERVSFEYRSVGLVRPWFQPDALGSRIWRSTDPDLLLSDGGDPANGVCPAYVSACVFVRNIVVVEKGASSSRSFRDLRFTVDANRLAERDLHLDPAILARAMRSQETASNSVLAARPLDLQSPRGFQLLQSESFALKPHVGTAARRAAGRRQMQLRAMTEVSGGGIRLPPETFGDSPPSPPPPPLTPARDEISILAFICKRLPKAPDPADGLNWN